MTRDEILRMTVKPILFNTEMVRAILDGRKSVTRRAIKQNQYIPIGKKLEPNEVIEKKPTYNLPFCEMTNKELINTLFRPAYQTGDILYVRETWGINYGGYNYFASLPQKMAERYKWRPSIHMPKEAARIFLRVTDVRVEKLRDIDEYQAEAEGVVGIDTSWLPTYINNFAKLWNFTLKEKDIEQYGWQANPWVWVYEFERMAVE